MEFSEKLKGLIKEKGVTAYIVANKTGISEATLSRLLNNNTSKPNIKNVDLLAKYFNVTSDWLLSSNNITDNATDTLSVSSSLSKSDKIASLRSLMLDIQQTGKKRDKIHFLPLMNIDAVGGAKNDICDTSEYIDEIIPVSGATETSIIIPVSGDSMMPTFSPGDLVVVDEVAEWRLFLEMGQYYIIALKDKRRLIKK